jgi:hypothetical protein
MQNNHHDNDNSNNNNQSLWKIDDLELCYQRSSFGLSSNLLSIDGKDVDFLIDLPSLDFNQLFPSSYVFSHNHINFTFTFNIIFIFI